MKEIAPQTYQFLPQPFFGEQVFSYAIVQSEIVFCFDIPQNTPQNREFLIKFKKPIRMIMSHGSTANGFEATKDVLLRAGVDIQIWLHEGDRHNRWLSITPDVLLSGEHKKLSEDLTLIHTPGHTAGSVCLHTTRGNGIIFTGDTLGGTSNGDMRSFELKDNELDSSMYFSGLRKLLAYDYAYMFPFHYLPISDAKIKLFAYLEKYQDLRT